MIRFIIGAIIGGTLGAFIVALVIANHEDDDRK